MTMKVAETRAEHIDPALVARQDPRLGKFHRLESFCQRKITALDERKKTLLHESFSMDN